jgi:hypothetical protein
MLDLPRNLAHIKRSLREAYGYTQATPQDTVLDPAWDKSVDIYPGMALVRAGGNKVTLPNATGDYPLGLAALYCAPVYGLDETAQRGINAFPTWVLGPDAAIEVDAPAFDAEATWTDPTDGTWLAVHVGTGASSTVRGQLVPAGTTGCTTRPVARLLQVKSETTLIIGGLIPAAA